MIQCYYCEQPTTVVTKHQFVPSHGEPEALCLDCLLKEWKQQMDYYKECAWKEERRRDAAFAFLSEKKLMDEFLEFEKKWNEEALPF